MLFKIIQKLKRRYTFQEIQELITSDSWLVHKAIIKSD